MGKFVQIIELKSSKFDEISKLEDEWRAATEGKRTTQRATVAEDRENPGRYFIIVEFASYDEAQKNNALRETSDFAKKLFALADEPPTFYNLDVVREDER
jgi:hypothetical protein